MAARRFGERGLLRVLCSQRAAAGSGSGQEPIALADITGSLARQCGFKGVVDLLKLIGAGQ